MNSHQNVHLSDFASECARRILELGGAAIAERGIFRLGLAGGDTPRAVYTAMSQLGGNFPWEKTLFTFGDERCVPEDDKDSNFAMAHSSLFSRIAVSEDRILRMRGEIEQALAADDYEALLSRIAMESGEPRYVHDVLLLGLGPDGHTASLFPGSPAVEESIRNVLPVFGPKPPPRRLTMTFPLINAARHIVFLIKDSGKADIVAEVQRGDPRHPASRVKSATWLLGY